MTRRPAKSRGENVFPEKSKKEVPDKRARRFGAGGLSELRELIILDFIGNLIRIDFVPQKKQGNLVYTVLTRSCLSVTFEIENNLF